MHANIDRSTVGASFPAALVSEQEETLARPGTSTTSVCAVKAGSNRIPAWFWLIPTLVVLLRLLPVFWLKLASPPEGAAFAGVSYIPKDFLAYTAFIRQVPEDGAFFFHNPFTTEPQSPRFLLLFHWVTGVAANVLHISPLNALEYSRVPLTFLFFATLWWFLRPMLPERKDRVMAAVLVAFASGFESWLQVIAPHLPEAFRSTFLQETWALYGWNLFASFFNPLWTAALIAAMLALRPMLVPTERSHRDLVLMGISFLLVYAIHPYTAIGILGIAAMLPVVSLLSGASLDWKRHLQNAMALGAGCLVIALLNQWQMADPVYKLSAGNIWGPQNSSVFWYPFTLGVLGWMAVFGIRRWLKLERALCLNLLAWITAIVLLHSSPILNGYKFVFLLPLPLCIFAAPIAREVLGKIRGTDAQARWLAVAAGIALFAGVAFQTFQAVQSTLRGNVVSPSLMQVVQTLSTRPAGNAMVPTSLGNVLPAFTHHRVWIGQWFLTPNYGERSQAFEQFTTNPALRQQFRDVVRQQQIRYVVVQASRAGLVSEQLEGAVTERINHGNLELLVLR